MNQSLRSAGSDRGEPKSAGRPSSRNSKASVSNSRISTDNRNKSSYHASSNQSKELLPPIQQEKDVKLSHLSEGYTSSGIQESKGYHYESKGSDTEQWWIGEASNHIEDWSSFNDIRSKLIHLDFDETLTSFTENGPHSEKCKPARKLFTLFSKKKEVISEEDLLELLILFTPTGAAFRESTDFLWEECDHKSSLNFSDFIVYGKLLRERLLDYELFSKLNADQKLIVTGARVFPGEPLYDPDQVRAQLLVALREQSDGTASPEVRPLRLYEVVFLEFYQENLQRSGEPPIPYVSQSRSKAELSLVESEDVPNSESRREGGGKGKRPESRSRDFMDSDEEISWGESPYSRQHRTHNKHRERASGRSDGPDSDYPSLATCNKEKKSSNRRVQRGKSKRKKSSQRHRGTRFGNVPFSERQKPPFNLDFQSAPVTDKYLGRLLEDEIEERMAADDYMLSKIWENFQSA